MEEALLFGQTGTLLGLLSDPPGSSEPSERDRDRPAFVLLNAGVVHRVGPHRLYVKLARALADMGFVVLRFDLSGIGDSPARRDGLPFEQSAVEEAREAMDRIATERGIGRFCLLGLCSGASLALRVARRDPRVAGIVQINSPGPPDMTPDEVRRTLSRHYRRIAFASSFRGKTLTKVAGLRFDVRGVLNNVGQRLARPFQRGSTESPAAPRYAADLRAVARRGVSIFQVHSEGDEGLDYLESHLAETAAELRRSGALSLEVVKGANHTFTLLSNQVRLLTAVTRWAERWVRLPDGASPRPDRLETGRS